MEAMSEITTRAASVAANAGVSIKQLSALGGTAEASTKIGGSKVGNGLKTLLLNLQDTSNNKIVETYDSLGISMTKIENGASKLKDPIQLLTELKDAYNALDEGDTRRTKVLNKIGGEQLATFYRNIEYSTYLNALIA
jgi:TP901 family phage tail tape measure protein